MKKTVRFLAAILLAPVLLTALFSGCGTGTVSIVGTSAGEKVTLRFYTDTDDATNEQRKWPEFVAGFKRDNPGIDVKMAPLVANSNYNEYWKKANIMLAAGEQIDLINLSSSDEVAKSVDDGDLEPLDGYAKAEGVNLDEIYKGIEPYKGHVYTISTELTPWMVFLNKGMLDAAGLPVPPRDWTWKDYREYAGKLTHGEGPDKVYGSFMYTWNEYFAVGAMSKILDIPTFTKDMKENFGNPVFRDGLQYRWNLENIDKSQVPYADVKSRNLSYRTEFFSGKVAMMPMGAWMVSDIQMTGQYPHTFKTTFAPWPRWDDTCKPNTSLLDGSGSGWAINANSKIKPEAYKFLRALTTEGLALAGNTWTAWRNADPERTVKGIAGSNESLYDLGMLENVLFDPHRVDNIYVTVGPAQTEISEGPWNEEAEKYLLGGQSLDTAMSNLERRAKDLIEKAQSK